MKKISLILLIVAIPFFTIAQKRGKKSKDKNLETNNAMITASDYLLITIYEPLKKADSTPDGIKILFDFHDFKSKDFISLSKRKYRSISEVLTSASSYGWELVDVSVVNHGSMINHFCYMKRRK